MTELPRIFIAYARKDAPLLDKLRRHLNVLQRNQHCHIFYDGEIAPGERWDDRLKAELHSANIFVLLVTDEFLNSDYVNEEELPKVLERERAGTAGVVPVILRDCLWEVTKLKDFQVVMMNGNPIDTTDGYAYAAREIFKVIGFQNEKRKQDEREVKSPSRNKQWPEKTTDIPLKKVTSEKKQEFIDPFRQLMLKIPGGSFDMGDTFGDGQENEKPVHRVSVPDFHLCKYLVNKSQWYEIMGNQPSVFNWSYQLPIEYISWEDVQEFVKKLNEKTGAGYRLPTEAEWEYAALGYNKFQNFKYAGSNTLNEIGWFMGNSEGTTHKVGRKHPNNLGLYDMSGNVWEWCQDVWHDDYSGAPNDGSVWTGGGDQTCRVTRGGSWNDLAVNCRCTCRYKVVANGRYNDIGFRLAR